MQESYTQIESIRLVLLAPIFSLLVIYWVAELPEELHHTPRPRSRLLPTFGCTVAMASVSGLLARRLQGRSSYPDGLVGAFSKPWLQARVDTKMTILTSHKGYQGPVWHCKWPQGSLLFERPRDMWLRPSPAGPGNDKIHTSSLSSSRIDDICIEILMNGMLCCSPQMKQSPTTITGKWHSLLGFNLIIKHARP